MPAYSTSSAVVALSVGDQGLSFNAETFAAPQAGQQFAVAKNPTAPGLCFVGMEVDLPTAPGTFEVDLQEADTDTDAAYQTVGSVTTVNAAGWNRGDFQVAGRFVRAYLKSLQNAGNLTVKITQR